jgi:soluble lytic murein transglycosylase-like protein
MKLNKLPSLTISNPLSNSPTINTKNNTLILCMKVVCVVVLALSLIFGAFLLNVHLEQSTIIQNKIQIEKMKGVNAEPGVVIDATASIIKREGNVPFAVAKKYAVWIYEAGARYSVDPLLILSVMAVESKFNYLAISPTGPVGLLQVAYSWHKEKTTHAGLFDPKNNIDVGTQIIKEYSDKSSTEIETLLRYNGSLGQSPVYAVKVLNTKRKYSDEIMVAVVNSI